MFKNYIHNELGITKDDIKTWIKEAAEEQAQRLVKQEFGKFDINANIARIISYEFNRFNSSIRHDFVKAICNKLTLQVKD